MTFLDVERAAGPLACNSTVSPHCGGLSDARETKPHAFSANPKAFLAASALQFQPGRFSLGAHDAVGLRASRSALQPRTVACRIAYLSPPTDVGSDYVNPSMAKFMADLPPGLTI